MGTRIVGRNTGGTEDFPRAENAEAAAVVLFQSMMYK